MEGKNVLIISEYIAPLQEIASVRWSKIAKYLYKNHCVKITVLTNEKIYGKKIGMSILWKDPTLEACLEAFDSYYEYSFGKEWKFFQKVLDILRMILGSSKDSLKEKKENVEEKGNNNNSFRKQLVDKILTIYQKLLQNGLEDYIQRKKARGIYKSFKKENLNFDVVISTYGPLWPHLVAEKIKKERKDIFWIADFRDPCAKDIESPRIFAQHKKFVKVHCREADVITVVQDEMNVYADEHQRVVTVTNGYDPDDLMPLIADEMKTFNIVYTGDLYEGRRKLDQLFHALKELCYEGIIDLQNIRFEYAGNSHNDCYNAAKKWDMEEIIVNNGIVPRDQALKMQHSAAILVQAGWNTKTERSKWSGKAYEYMMMCKPIVYMMSGEVPYSIPSKEIGKLGGVCYEYARHEETYPLLKEYIKKKYMEWQTTGKVTITRDESYVRQFQYEGIAEQVWNLFPGK